MMTAGELSNGDLVMCGSDGLIAIKIATIARTVSMWRETEMTLMTWTLGEHCGCKIFAAHQDSRRWDMLRYADR